ncbi:MAG: AMIN domain-containing protein [Leptolyngbyaceae bacterium]|nr:AMIN domain-containing protein [Leptolyngbyaceae bacterium]
MGNTWMQWLPLTKRLIPCARPHQRLGLVDGRWTALVGIRIAFSSLVAIATVCLNTTATWAAQLVQWSFNPDTRRLELVIPGGTTPQYFLLAQPPRIVVDLPGTQVGNVPEVSTYNGQVRSVRVGQFQPDLTRIVIEMASDVVFAPGHIDIQTPDPAIGTPSVAETWFIRPLLVGDGTLPPLINPTPASEPLNPSPPVDLAAQPDVPRLGPGVESAEPGETEIETVAADTVTAGSGTNGPVGEPGDIPTNNIPPLEPGALEISIELMEQAEPVDSPILEESQGGDRPLPPPLPSSPPMTSPTTDVNPASPVPFPQPPMVENVEDPMAAAPDVPVIAFGQDFQADNAPNPEVVQDAPAIDDSAIIVAVDNGVLLPAGTMLMLRYPRDVELSLSRARARQEVLVTAATVRDRAGTVLIPEGSLIIGRFEASGGGGLRFVAQALALGDRTVTMEQTTADLSNMTSIQPNQLIEIQVGDAIRR